jgi:hypothetical protein
MKQFETHHQSPAEVKSEGFSPIHLLKTYNEKGEVVGFAELQYYGGKPSFYFVQNLANTTVRRGAERTKEAGVGNELILEMNNFLDSKKSIGYLSNTSGIPNLYTSRGWKQSDIAPNFNYYGDLTQEEELAIIEKLKKSYLGD